MLENFATQAFIFYNDLSKKLTYSNTTVSGKTSDSGNLFLISASNTVVFGAYCDNYILKVFKYNNNWFANVCLNDENFTVVKNALVTIDFSTYTRIK